MTDTPPAAAGDAVPAPSPTDVPADVVPADVPVVPLLDAGTARVHAGEYALLAAIEGGLAEAYERQRIVVGDQRSLLFRSLDLAAVGARRRAANYAHLSRVMAAYATLSAEDRVGTLERVVLDITDVHDGDRRASAGDGRDAG